jgi:2-aminoethylphosphonate-pyruvate transaminase
MSAYKGPDGQEDMPHLLTVDPVTTTRNLKFSMLADYAPRDNEFSTLLAAVRNSLLRVAGADASFGCVLLQGPAAFAIEAALASFCPTRRKKTLVICNGADGEDAAKTLEAMGRPLVRLTYRETSMPRASDVAKTLDEDRNITHVWLAHIETATGFLNPLSDIAQVVKAKGRIMMLDATASFGGVAIDMLNDNIDVLVSTASSCLGSIPGVSFVIGKTEQLQFAAGQSHSRVLDLHSQWTTQHEHGHFNNTPPTHALAALRTALRELDDDGGVTGRSQRFSRNAETLRERLKAMGFSLLLADVEASPVLQTVLAPKSATFDYTRFYDSLREQGFAIMPGRLGQRASFRIGCIGPFDERLMPQVVVAIEQVLNAMDVRSLAPGDQ